MDQHVGVVQHRLAGLALVDEVRRQVALVELHPLHQINGGVKRLALLDGDDAVLADLVHRLGDELADLGVVVGAGGADLGDLVGVLHVAAHLLEFRDDGLDRHLDAALDLGAIRARGDVAEALAEDGLGVNGGGGGAVAGDLAGLVGDLLDHLRAHVLVGVLELDLLGDRHAVFGDGRGAVGLFKHDVSTARAEGDFDGAGELADAVEDCGAGFLVESDLFSSHSWFSVSSCVLGFKGARDRVVRR